MINTCSKRIPNYIYIYIYIKSNYNITNFFTTLLRSGIDENKIASSYIFMISPFMRPHNKIVIKL